MYSDAVARLNLHITMTIMNNPKCTKLKEIHMPVVLNSLAGSAYAYEARFPREKKTSDDAVEEADCSTGNENR